MAAARGLDRTLGRGMVWGLKLAKGEEAPLVLTDAPAPAELAGSAVLDQDGQLVGLLSAKYKDADRLSYAVPADWIAELPERAAAIAAAQQLAGNAAPQADAGPATLPAGNGHRARIPVRVGDGWSYRLVSGKPRKTIHLEVIAVDGNRITERLTTDDSSSFSAASGTRRRCHAW
jgi:hypothetical protein